MDRNQSGFAAVRSVRTEESQGQVDRRIEAFYKIYGDLFEDQGYNPQIAPLMRPMAATKFEYRNPQFGTISKYKSSNVENRNPTAHGFWPLEFGSLDIVSESVFSLFDVARLLQSSSSYIVA